MDAEDLAAGVIEGRRRTWKTCDYIHSLQMRVVVVDARQKVFNQVTGTTFNEHDTLELRDAAGKEESHWNYDLNALRRATFLSTHLPWPGSHALSS